MKRVGILVLLLATLCMTVHSKVIVPSLLSEHVILQQQTAVKLWGKARPESEVCITASWTNALTKCKADADGNWMVKIQTPAGSFKSHRLVFDDGEQTTVNDVLVGEVWLASGQSNMEMPLKGFTGCCVRNGVDEAIAASAIHSVRMFNVPRKQSYEPLTDCSGRWMTTERVQDVLEFSATAWYYALSVSRALHLPVGIINCSYGGSSVESWTSRDLLETYPDVSLKPEAMEKIVSWERPLLMYNAMFLPVKNFTIRGIIWYQGETNVGRHETYAQRLANMVALWRKEIGLGEIPFYYVEIAPYDYDTTVQDDKSAYLREAQFKAQSLIPNSGLISTNDLVEPFERHNVHPREKAKVGYRLSYLALNRTYGMKELVYSGPVYKDVTFQKDAAYIGFTNLDMGICRNDDIRGFEIAGEDRFFHPADSVSLQWQTNHIVVSSKAVPHPVAVRYCFHDFQPGTLIGGNELPALPFRTDNW